MRSLVLELFIKCWIVAKPFTYSGAAKIVLMALFAPSPVL